MTAKQEPAGSPQSLCVLFHEGELQGAGIAVQRVLPGLRALGWEPHAWFPHQGPIQQAIEPLADSARFQQGYFAFSLRGWRASPGLPARIAGLPGYVLALRAMLAQLQPSVVHANTLLSLPEATVARAIGLPVVLHMHEALAPTRKTALTLRWAAAVADVVVTVSDAVQNLFLPYAGATPAVRVYNGLPASAFEDPRSPSPGERLVVGAVGGATAGKGIDVFLDAARLLVADSEQIDFLHVGPPPWETHGFAAELAARVAAFPAGRLTMAGIRPAAPELRKMDIFVMASRHEAFGLASVEAMAAGIPVIATTVGGLPEQIEHLQSGILVPPDDPGAIAQWIRRLAAEPELRHRLGQAGRERARALFTIEQQCAGLDRAYRQAIAAADARRGRSPWDRHLPGPRHRAG